MVKVVVLSHPACRDGMMRHTHSNLLVYGPWIQTFSMVHIHNIMRVKADDDSVVDYYQYQVFEDNQWIPVTQSKQTPQLKKNKRRTTVSSSTYKLNDVSLAHTSIEYNNYLQLYTSINDGSDGNFEAETLSRKLMT
jgi:hypothetical protein